MLHPRPRAAARAALGAPQRHRDRAQRREESLQVGGQEGRGRDRVQKPAAVRAAPLTRLLDLCITSFHLLVPSTTLCTTNGQHDIPSSPRCPQQPRDATDLTQSNMNKAGRFYICSSLSSRGSTPFSVFSVLKDRHAQDCWAPPPHKANVCSGCM